ncbi:MAG: hypothetical protein CMI31_10115 [Opitutae bacterium]|nr:hypothetical protein [Opitutae bacterium]
MLRYAFLALPLLVSHFQQISANPMPMDFLSTYCFRCHGPEKQKADRRFDFLTGSIEGFKQQELWQEILDQLNLGEMPPEDERQPSDKDRLKIVGIITQGIADSREKFAGKGSHTVLRRLNKFEYANTIGDLLGLNTESWNPAADFPSDILVDGFDNDGEGLVTSGLLLEKYFPAAEEAVARATNFVERPETKSYLQKSPFYFQGKESKGLPKLFQVDRFRFVPETPYTDLYGRYFRGGHLGFLPLRRIEGIPRSGRYTMRVKASAVTRTHSYGKILDDFRNGDPLVMEFASVDRKGSTTVGIGNVTKSLSLASFELTDAEPQWFEWTGYLEKGYEVEVRFRNGTEAAKRLVRLLLNKADQFPEFKRFAKMKDGGKGGLERWHGTLQAYKGPRLRVWEIQLEGPHVEEWPPKGHATLYGDLKAENLGPKNIENQLIKFAKLAFRRPPMGGELEPILGMVQARLGEGVSPLQSLQLGFQTILSAPGFIYLNEGEGELDDYALASRLSYFLWSSMPDAELFELAEQGKLKDSVILTKQVDRLLADPKSKRLTSNFLRVWLELDNIGKMPPSKEFVSFYRDNLESAMREETNRLFDHVLNENLAPLDLLASNYSFLNRELAEHYGIPGLEGNHFRKVRLPGKSRGGLLGHGSFLTASANGVDTSPVVRGIYVMNKLLDYTPPPPPDDVPEIEPDVRGATTLREQLIKHRADAACAQCHNKIDPAGFALENYDAIGAWRDQYDRRLKVDSSGKMPDGKTFSSSTEFRKLVVAQDETFIRCLTKKLLTYAIGRQLNSGDRPSIDKITRNMANRDKGLRDLVHAIVASKSFQLN